MKFVFELEGKFPQVSAVTIAWNTEQYDGPPVAWNGSRAEIDIYDCIDWDDDEKRREGEALHIEGDTAALRKALTSIIELLDIHDGYERERLAKLLFRSVLCTECGHWNDPLLPWHGDGKGNACYGLLTQRKALVQAEQPEPKAGDLQRTRELVEQLQLTDEQRVFATPPLVWDARGEEVDRLRAAGLISKPKARA